MVECRAAQAGAEAGEVCAARSLDPRLAAVLVGDLPGGNERVRANVTRRRPALSSWPAAKGADTARTAE